MSLDPSLRAAPGSVQQRSQLSRWLSRWLPKARLWSILYLLMVPSLVGLLLFTWWPNLDSVRYAFYRWNGAGIEDFTGLANFRRALFDDPLFWQTFQLVGILLAANLVKLWPSILVAIVLHRLRSERWQYLYRVLFVIPMVIPGLVWLLVWKAVFTEGLLNQALNASGGMAVLDGLDRALPAAGTWIAGNALVYNAAAPVASAIAQPLGWLHALTGGWYGLGLFGLLVLASTGPQVRWRALLGERWLVWLVLLAAGAAVWGLLRLPLLAVVGLGVGPVLRRLDRINGPSWTKLTGVSIVGLALVLLALTALWPTPTGAFAEGEPAWLGHSRLVVPSLILWGFPWVGTVGVLIYLAGLSAIPAEVYEAAEIDGAGSLRKAFTIELPLILTQVRINLIFMTIGTLTDFGFILILLGSNGGPNQGAMVPGLYMYNQAFLQGQYGYACALGMILFLLTLGLTIVYQRVVRVRS